MKSKGVLVISNVNISEFIGQSKTVWNFDNNLRFIYIFSLVFPSTASLVGVIYVYNSTRVRSFYSP